MSVPGPRVLVVTGAGISAESGIPTFRGAGGYWRSRDPATLATATAFAASPGEVWEWYRERRQRIRRSEPNAAHRAIVKLAWHAREFLLLTQNVDDLHARAEWAGRRLAGDQIVQIHGDIFVSRCTRCDFSTRDDAQADGAPGVPRCPRCGQALRPGVVWFDEELDPANVRRVERYLAADRIEVVLVVGTTAAFGYIVRWARRGARRGRLIEVNPEETAISPYATEAVRAPAAEALPGIVDRLAGEASA